MLLLYHAKTIQSISCQSLKLTLFSCYQAFGLDVVVHLVGIMQPQRESFSFWMVNSQELNQPIGCTGYAAIPRMEIIVIPLAQTKLSATSSVGINWPH
jgi:hypothetical protein